MTRHPDTIEVLDGDAKIRFSYADVTKFHGPGSPGGVALGFKALELGLPLLEPDGPCERREVAVCTAFGGPGARDAFEYALRAVSGDRYALDASLERSDLPPTRARFVFQLTYRDRLALLILRDGFVTEEFVELVARDDREDEEDARLVRLKLELADRVMRAPADRVYEATLAR